MSEEKRKVVLCNVCLTRRSCIQCLREHVQELQINAEACERELAEVRLLRELDEHATGYLYGKYAVVRDILFNDWSVHDGMGHHVDNLSKAEALALAKKGCGGL